MGVNSITKFSNQRATDYEVNRNFNKGWTFSILNKIRQTIDRASVDSSGQDDIWSEAYIDSNGQNNSVTAAGTNAVFDTDKYKVPVDISSATAYYVVIEATSISGLSDFAINNCYMLPGGTGSWLLIADEGDLEVSKAKVLKTLFYGTNGSNPRAEATYMTSPTAFKTSVSGDIGKQAHYAQGTKNVSLSAIATYTGTFVDTTTNTDCDSWSYCSATSAGVRAAWEMPSGSTLNIKGTTGGSGTSDETGTDTSGDTQSNPATCQLETFQDAGSGVATVRSIIFCSGDITWVEVDANNVTNYVNTDFKTDNSIPDMTDGTSEDLTAFMWVIEHAISAGTYPATISKLIGKVLFEDWESGISVNHRLENATENSGWIADGILDTFTAFTSEPTKYLIGLIAKSSSPTADTPSINGAGFYTE
jgi:hypothetical protein